MRSSSRSLPLLRWIQKLGHWRLRWVRRAGTFSPGPAAAPGGYEAVEMEHELWIRVRDVNLYLARKARWDRGHR